MKQSAPSESDVVEVKTENETETPDVEEMHYSDINAASSELGLTLEGDSNAEVQTYDIDVDIDSVQSQESSSIAVMDDSNQGKNMFFSLSGSRYLNLGQ